MKVTRTRTITGVYKSLESPLIYLYFAFDEADFIVIL